MCGGSPLIPVFVFVLFLRYCFHVGEITQGRYFNSTLVLPSLNRNILLFICWFCSDVGEITQERGDICTLVLPSVIHLLVLLFIFIELRVGEIHRRGDENLNSRSPLYEPNYVLFNGHKFDHILGAFCGHHFSHDPRLCGGIHSSPRAYIMYIYSLGHFLTTKGALIDGD